MTQDVVKKTAWVEELVFLVDVGAADVTSKEGPAVVLVVEDNRSFEKKLEVGAILICVIDLKT